MAFDRQAPLQVVAETIRTVTPCSVTDAIPARIAGRRSAKPRQAVFLTG